MRLSLLLLLLLLAISTFVSSPCTAVSSSSSSSSAAASWLGIFHRKPLHRATGGRGGDDDDDNNSNADGDLAQSLHRGVHAAAARLRAWQWEAPPDRERVVYFDGALTAAGDVHAYSGPAAAALQRLTHALACAVLQDKVLVLPPCAAPRGAAVGGGGNASDAAARLACYLEPIGSNDGASDASALAQRARTATYAQLHAQALASRERYEREVDDGHRDGDTDDGAVFVFSAALRKLNADTTRQQQQQQQRHGANEAGRRFSSLCAARVFTSYVFRLTTGVRGVADELRRALELPDVWLAVHYDDAVELRERVAAARAGDADADKEAGDNGGDKHTEQTRAVSLHRVLSHCARSYMAAANRIACVSGVRDIVFTGATTAALLAPPTDARERQHPPHEAGASSSSSIRSAPGAAAPAGHREPDNNDDHENSVRCEAQEGDARPLDAMAHLMRRPSDTLPYGSPRKLAFRTWALPLYAAAPPPPSVSVTEHMRRCSVLPARTPNANRSIDMAPVRAAMAGTAVGAAAEHDAHFWSLVYLHLFERHAAVAIGQLSSPFSRVLLEVMAMDGALVPPLYDIDSNMYAPGPMWRPSRSTWGMRERERRRALLDARKHERERRQQQQQQQGQASGTAVPAKTDGASGGGSGDAHGNGAANGRVGGK